MAKIKLTKTAIDAAQPQAQPVELRDTLVPGFMCKVTPAGRKVFMLQYRTNAGERRKPALGLYGELTVEQARSLAQTWLAEVRRGGDPGGDKTEARKAPTVKELCGRFMSDYSKVRNKPSTQKGYQGNIDRNIIPILGRMKVHDVKRPDVAMMMKKLEPTPNETDVIVKSVVRQARSEPISVDYAMEKTESGWKVYDVKIAGISLVQNYRSTFSAEIQRNGVDGLIKALAEKNGALTGKNKAMVQT
ncbi:MAG: hypothetical protein B7Z60_07945 [Ferrovum sp. 37-45-19]|nr:MAG: hypothetical protein B7Z60_07945 [Ferrovum sp. 37-45-19]